MMVSTADEAAGLEGKGGWEKYSVIDHNYDESKFQVVVRKRLMLKFTSYLAWLGKSSYFEFGKHQLPIYDDVKDAVAPWN